MKFEKTKVKHEVKDILNKYFDGSKDEFKNCTDEIVNLIKSQYIAREHFRKNEIKALLDINKLSNNIIMNK